MAAKPTMKMPQKSKPVAEAKAADAWVSEGAGEAAPATRPAKPVDADAARPPVRLTIDLDPSLHQALKMAAATEGRKLAVIVRELLEAYVAKR